MTEEKSRLPDSFLSKGLALADGAIIFGVPLKELSRQDLIAVAAQGWKAYTDKLNEQGLSQMNLRGLK